MSVQVNTQMPQYISPSMNANEKIAQADFFNANIKPDEVAISSKKTKKQSPINKVNSFIGNFKKVFATASEYLKGGVKGLEKGVLVGSVLYTTLSLVHKIKSKSAPHKNFAAPLAIVSGVATFGLNVWKGSLNANSRNSEIDHRWKTGHNK